VGYSTRLSGTREANFWSWGVTGAVQTSARLKDLWLSQRRDGRMISPERREENQELVKDYVYL